MYKIVSFTNVKNGKFHDVKNHKWYQCYTESALRILPLWESSRLLASRSLDQPGPSPSHVLARRWAPPWPSPRVTRPVCTPCQYPPHLGPYGAPCCAQLDLVFHLWNSRLTIFYIVKPTIFNIQETYDFLHRETYGFLHSWNLRFFTFGKLAFF